MTAPERIAWERDGFIGPFRALPAADAEACADELLQALSAPGRGTMNRHCDLPALARLCRAADVWTRLSELLGPDLVLWRTNFFLGNPRLDWHEDRHGNLIGGGFSLSAQLSLKQSDADNCTLIVPGSHRMTPEQKSARYGLEPDPREGGNVRYRGQVAGDQFMRMALQPGEAFIFHPGLLHASSGVLGERGVDSKRVSLVFRVTTPEARIAPSAHADGACPILVQGVDRHGLNTYGRWPGSAPGC